MNSTAIIEEIKRLPPQEQSEVIQFAFELAKNRQLSASELGELADRLASSEDPAEILRLRSAMTRGFYGEYCFKSELNVVPRWNILGRSGH